MKLKGTASLALLLTGALVLGACTSDADPGDTGTQAGGDTTTAAPTEGGTDEEPGDNGATGDSVEACEQPLGITESADGEVRYTAGPGNWNGYNATTSGTYSTYNNAVAGMMFSGFMYYGVDGTICQDENFGTYEVISEDPMVVEYTIADDAAWSDGTPITINDYLLDYAAQNPEWLVPGFASGEDSDAAAVFDHISISLAQKAPEGPQGEVDGKTFTLEYTNPDPDYQLNMSSTLPAHVAAEQSGLTPQELAQAILDRDAETVSQAAEWWNTGWIYQPGELPSDMAEVPSSGPYVLKEGGWQAGTALTLTQNENYWGEPPATKEIVFRFLEDAGQAQALQNGDVQVIQPQATVDTLPQLEALAPAIAVETFSTLTWEHLDYNFLDSSPFSDNNGGHALREAFALCVPRQGIVDTLIKPIDPNAEVLNAREVFPFQDNYDEVLATSYPDARYDEVDLDRAQQLVEESGVATPIDLRIGYRSGNQRRTDTVAMIKSSCDQVGFNVEDINAEDFFENALVSGDFDIALYAWARSGQITSGSNIYTTVGQQNNQGYSNDAVDEAFRTLSGTLDEAVQLEQTKIIETNLWDDLFGLPLYASPGVVAYDANLQNVRPTATQSQVVWNAHQWVAAS
ncbi:MAG: ABC transporter family substrate-binding protein [Propionibacterium sp.]|nr:ABC transporter family substrate-binding protein [Propionibacterium sp.]